ncbi:hypothetical protein KS4_12650 [Poriferisphaera corsica]|uniref:Uncharacterized protein n=1 Tax=Poriferisphaera corsica TaxID=2528020 RepID=A0A517YSK9_9BACT|nr:hypothetical protein [Poriferisphaera corsica]QDU33220.1 hypothetical protein KS4_12650 [Poriferisphaera corsica]
MNQDQNDLEEGMQEWSPPVGWVGKLFAWLMLLIIAIVIVWMIIWIFTPEPPGV